jgi:hypothetical protein
MLSGFPLTDAPRGRGEAMHPYQVSALGLVVDIIGAFFLAAEAIKIENLRTLRDKILRRLSHAAISPVYPLGKDEELTPARERQFREAFEFGPPWGAKHPRMFTFLHNLAGFLVFLMANWVFGGRLGVWLWDGAAWMLASTPALVAYPVIFLIAAFLIWEGTWMLGEMVHVLLIHTIRYSIGIIEFIERRTSDGVVGIVGFCLLLVGFFLQLFGTIAGGQSP